MQTSDVTVGVARMSGVVVVVMVDIRVDIRVGTIGNGMLGCLASDVPNEKTKNENERRKSD